MIGRNFCFKTQFFIDMAPLRILSYHIKQVEFVEHVGRFTHTDQLLTQGGEIAPTCSRVELQFGEFYQMKDGKIGLIRANYDAGTMMRQSGLLP